MASAKALSKTPEVTFELVAAVAQMYSSALSRSRRRRLWGRGHGGRLEQYKIAVLEALAHQSFVGFHSGSCSSLRQVMTCIDRVVADFLQETEYGSAEEELLLMLVDRIARLELMVREQPRPLLRRSAAYSARSAVVERLASPAH